MALLPRIRHAARWLIMRAGLTEEAGASAVEYGIMIMLIAAVILLAVVFLGARTSGTFSCAGQTVVAKGVVAGCG